MNPATNPAMNTPMPMRAPLDDEPAQDLYSEDLRWAVGLVEDWLLHASAETLDELAEFTYGRPPHDGEHDHRRLRPIIELLGEAAIRLRPAPPPTTAEPATQKRGPSR